MPCVGQELVRHCLEGSWLAHSIVGPCSGFASMRRGVRALVVARLVGVGVPRRRSARGGGRRCSTARCGLRAPTRVGHGSRSQPLHRIRHGRPFAASLASQVMVVAAVVVVVVSPFCPRACQQEKVRALSVGLGASRVPAAAARICSRSIGESPSGAPTSRGALTSGASVVFSFAPKLTGLGVLRQLAKKERLGAPNIGCIADSGAGCTNLCPKDFGPLAGDPCCRRCCCGAVAGYLLLREGATCIALLIARARARNRRNMGSNRSNLAPSRPQIGLTLGKLDEYRPGVDQTWPGIAQIWPEFVPVWPGPEIGQWAQEAAIGHHPNSQQLTLRRAGLWTDALNRLQNHLTNNPRNTFVFGQHMAGVCQN